MAYTIWLVMFGNGSRIGMGKIIMKLYPPQILWDRIQELSELCEVVRGSILIFSLDLPIADHSRHWARLNPEASVAPSLNKPFPILSLSDKIPSARRTIYLLQEKPSAFPRRGFLCVNLP